MRRILVAVAAIVVLAPAGAQAADRYNSAPYRGLIKVSNMLAHEEQLQAFADASGGTRVASSPGNEKTINYVTRTMRDAGWKVRKQPFDFPYFEQLAPSTFAQTAPTARTFTPEEEFATFDFSGSGDVTGPLVPVDVVVPIGNNPPSTSTSGCEAEDFAGFPAGAVALMQRGTCTFEIKAANATAAGAVGAVIFNEGQPGRDEVLSGTATNPQSIPLIGTSYAIGAALVESYRAGEAPAVHITTSTLSETRTTYNVIADSPFGDPDRTVVVSAHNDSVAAGPGINDDGSGVAMDLELAKNLGKAGKYPTNHFRFLWVGDEEGGLVGSTYYVNSLTDAQKLKIIAMLDFDMVASPNYARQVYDGDGSEFGSDVSGPSGSGFIEGLFNDFFDSQSQAHEPIPFDGRSDYVAFTDAGIPAGGIFTGAEQLKTPEEQALFGGTAGIALDPCYHQACDTIDNLNTKAFREMSQAAADVVFQLSLIQGPIRDGRPVKTVRLAKTFRGEMARR
jgi:Zn-dependent M28 family amino/carboxypeptidase